MVAEFFLQIPGLVGRCSAICISRWRPPHGCWAFGFSDFRISRCFLQVAAMVARIFRTFRISRGFLQVTGIIARIFRISINWWRPPLVAELSDFRIFGFTEVFCKLLA